MTKLRAVARRRWSVLVAGVVLGMLAGALSSLMAPKGKELTRYRVTQLIIANRSAPQQGNVEQDTLRVTRGAVAEKAAKKLGVASASSISSSVSATADTDSSSIEVSSSGTNAAAAQERVEAFVDAFLEVVNADLSADQQRRLKDMQAQLDQAQRDLDAFNAANPTLGLVPSSDPVVDQTLMQQRSDLRQQVESMKSQLQQERLNAKTTLPYSTLGPDAPKVVNSDLLPVPTGMPFRMALLGFLGAVLAIGLVIILERVIPRIDTRDELVDTLPLPVLAEVGYFPHRSIPTADDGTLQIEGAWAEPYRRIRSAIQFVQSEGSAPAGASGSMGDPPRPSVFMITSASPGEGKSTTTAVTALAMAETGERTLAVGGDFRRPSIHTLLGVAKAPGIREHARLDIDRPTLDQIIHPTSHEHLYLAPSGAPGREVVGMAESAKELISAAAEEGATVLVDTSPVEVANDAIDLLPVVDRVIVVVRSGRTTRRALLNTIDMLEQHGAQVMGTALIATPGLGRQQYYYQGYYSDEQADGPGGSAGDGNIFPDDGSRPSDGAGTGPNGPAVNGGDGLPTSDSPPAHAAPPAHATPPVYASPLSGDAVPPRRTVAGSPTPTGSSTGPLTGPLTPEVVGGAHQVPPFRASSIPPGT